MAPAGAQREAFAMTPRQRVIQILRSATAARIRFSFPTATGRVTIARQSFERVARAIERGRVHVATVRNFRQGVAAQYDPANNTLEVPPIIGRVDEGLVLHECTHCVYDLLRTGITAADDEASAYVVSSLYFRMTGLRPPRWGAEPHKTAGVVADGLLQQYQAGNVAVPQVDPNDFLGLRLVVMTHPVYFMPGLQRGDFRLGLPITGGSYTHNG